MKVGPGHSTGTWGHLFPSPHPLVLQSGITVLHKGKVLMIPITWHRAVTATGTTSLGIPVPWEQDACGTWRHALYWEQRMTSSTPVHSSTSLRQHHGKKEHVLGGSTAGAQSWHSWSCSTPHPALGAPGAILTPGTSVLG